MLGQRALMSPTILVTNRSTYSDGEDFTEGYRALKLGKVVGEPTAGSVIFTNIVSLLDGTRMGLPSTKVFDGAGQELEGHPRPVDIVVARASGEWYSGGDAQLERAAEELLRQIDQGDKTRKPTSRPATRPVVADAPAVDGPSSATRPETHPDDPESLPPPATPSPTNPRRPR
jgi:C-terminal processing protease CtpA/Prc